MLPIPGKPNLEPFGPSLLGLQGAREMKQTIGAPKLTAVGTIVERGGVPHIVSGLNPTLVSGSRRKAVASLVLAPVWISIRAIFSIVASLANLVSGGHFSRKDGLVDDTLLGGLKAMGCSLLSILTTPANVAVEGIATISHVLKPELNKIDLLAAHMWTGFVGASLPKKPTAEQHPPEIL